eukprot:6202772-Pleurochrysis_carterae.AAC.2
MLPAADACATAAADARALALLRTRASSAPRRPARTAPSCGPIARAAAPAACSSREPGQTGEGFST